MQQVNKHDLNCLFLDIKVSVMRDACCQKLWQKGSFVQWQPCTNYVLILSKPAMRILGGFLRELYAWLKKGVSYLKLLLPSSIWRVLPWYICVRWSQQSDEIVVAEFWHLFPTFSIQFEVVNGRTQPPLPWQEENLTKWGKFPCHKLPDD